MAFFSPSNESHDSAGEDVLIFWKEKIFAILFTSIVLIAVFPYTVSILKAISDKAWLHFIIYTSVYALSLFILIFRSLPFLFRCILGIVGFYVLGVSALILVGPLGSGRVWLFSLSIIACLLLGVKTGIITVTINSLFFAFIGFLLSRGQLRWIDGAVSLNMWFVTSITFVFLNTITTIALGALVKGLEDKLQKEQNIAGELRESRNRLAQAIDGSSIAAYILDGEHRITHWNRACEAISGMTADEAVGTKWHWSLFYDSEEPMLADYILRDKPDFPLEDFTGPDVRPSSLIEGVFEGEIPIMKRDKKRRWYFRTAAPLSDMNGRMTGAIETITDITKLKNIEEQLYKAQRMESVGRLAGGVAHDYNNISSIIIGYAELALAGMEKDNPLYESLDEILKAAERSAKITKQLLSFARRQPVEPRALEINRFIGDMLKMLKRLIGENIALDWVAGEAVWPVLIDPSQVDQILANLCVNARDAISDVGRIVIETKNVCFTGEDFPEKEYFLPGDYVMISVSDDGRGMEPDVVENIFEPFYTTKETGKGTGLGLATVYGIVKQNSGFIDVYSEPGRGTTFRIFLKRCERVSEPVAGKKRDTLPRGHHERILVVEDDLAILRLTEKILTDQGFDVLSESSPSEALQKAEKGVRKIDFLLTDVVMPEMNGKEFSLKMQTLYPEIKVLYMSGYTSNFITERGILDDSINFISKPFSRRELLGKISGML